MGTGICVRTPTENDNNNINELEDYNIINNFEYEEYIPIKNNENDNLNGKENNNNNNSNVNNQKEPGNKFNESDIPIDIIKDS